MSLVRGASVVSRTAELTLEQTPARMIDGEPESAWTTPANDIQQSATFSLPAPARITGIGTTTLARLAYAASKVRFESSLDGVTFKPLLTQTSGKQSSDQFTQVPPTEAQYIRVIIDEAHGAFATLTTLHVRGAFLGRPQLADVSGCWSINGAPSRFTSERGTVRGTIARDGTLLAEGGSDQFVYRLAWIDGPQYGLAAMTLTPGGGHLTGMKWHERAEPFTFGESWFGEETPGCAPAVPTTDSVARLWLKKAGWYPLYGLHFDERDQLIVQESTAALDLIVRLLGSSGKVQLTSHEMRGSTPEANRKRTERRIQSLREVLTRSGADIRRIGFLPAGSDNQTPRMPSELILSMYSMVDIRVAGSGV